MHMIRANKTYGFTIAVKELKETVPNIFRYASAYKRINNLTSQGLWEMFIEREKEEDILSEEPRKDKKKKKSRKGVLKDELEPEPLPEIDPYSMESEVYNMCHFWSNFEIARLDWFRSVEYNAFFDMMDHSGGFWMERVSDTKYRIPLMWSANQLSGAMLPSTPSRPELFSPPRTSTTSGILATGTRRFSTAPPTRPQGSYLGYRTSKRRRAMRGNGSRKTSTGLRTIRRKRTAWGADVSATRRFRRSREKRGVVSLSGSRLRAVGPRRSQVWHSGV